jgi:hypothetical protein
MEAQMRKLLSVPRVQDWMNLVFGSALFLSPWILRFIDVHQAAWNAWLCGALVACVAILAVVAFRPWEEWHGVAIGAWLIVAPWVLGFTSIIAAAAAHVIFGGMILAAAGWEIWHVRHYREEFAY